MKQQLIVIHTIRQTGIPRMTTHLSYRHLSKCCVQKKLRYLIFTSKRNMLKFLPVEDQWSFFFLSSVKFVLVGYDRLLFERHVFWLLALGPLIVPRLVCFRKCGQFNEPEPQPCDAQVYWASVAWRWDNTSKKVAPRSIAVCILHAAEGAVWTQATSTASITNTER